MCFIELIIEREVPGPNPNQMATEGSHLLFFHYEKKSDWICESQEKFIATEVRRKCQPTNCGKDVELLWELLDTASCISARHHFITPFI